MIFSLCVNFIAHTSTWDSPSRTHIYSHINTTSLPCMWSMAWSLPSNCLWSIGYTPPHVLQWAWLLSVSIPGVCVSQEVIEQLVEMTAPHHFLLVTWTRFDQSSVDIINYFSIFLHDSNLKPGYIAHMANAWSNLKNLTCEINTHVHVQCSHMHAWKLNLKSLDIYQSPMDSSPHSYPS